MNGMDFTSCHKAKDCRWTLQCPGLGCGGKHHSLLHGVKHVYCNFRRAGCKIVKFTRSCHAVAAAMLNENASTESVEQDVVEELNVPDPRGSVLTNHLL